MAFGNFNSLASYLQSFLATSRFFAKFRLVSVYLHPDAVKQELHSLLCYLKTLDLRDWTFIMGDFNRADALAQEDWDRLLGRYGFTDGHPHLATFRKPTGETKLDRILLPTAFPQNLLLQHLSTVRWVGEKLLHGIVSMKLKHRQAVPKDPKLRGHHVIPHCIFRPGMVGLLRNQLTVEALRCLERAILHPSQAQTTHALPGLVAVAWHR